MPPYLARHFFVDPPIDSDAIRINSVGIREAMPPGTVDRPGARDDWLIIHFFDRVRIGTRPEPPFHDAGSMMLWKPRTPQHYGHPRRRWCHSWLHCEGRWIDRAVRSIGVPVNEPIPAISSDITDQHLIAVVEELTGSARPDAAIVTNLLDNWLRRVHRAWRSAHLSPPIPPHYHRARRALQQRYTRRVSIDGLARQLGLSPPHFSTEFKRHFGVSPMRYVISLRLQHARHLLTDRSLPISEVAQRVGYPDVYQFSRLFKKHEGVSPSTVRARDTR